MRTRSLLSLLSRSTDPTSPLAEGDAWYNNTLGRLRLRIGGSVTKSVAYADEVPPLLPLAIYPRVGQWMHAPPTGTYQGNLMALDRLYYIPLPIAKTCSIDRISWNITGAGSASSVFFMGWYNSDPTTMLPSTLGETWQGSSASTTGINYGLVTTTFTGPALYWVAVSAGSGAVAPTIGATLGGSPYVSGFGTNGPPALSLACYYATYPRANGAFPTTPPAIVGTQEFSPRISLRVSA